MRVRKQCLVLIISIRPPPAPEPTPEPTTDQAVEIPVNYSEPGNIQENQAVNITEQPRQPDIEEPEQYIDSNDSNAILNLLMGCNEISGNEPQIEMTSD